MNIRDSRFVNFFRYYESYCGMVNGSFGEGWPPRRERTSISMYSTDLCRWVLNRGWKKNAWYLQFFLPDLLLWTIRKMSAKKAWLSIDLLEPRKCLVAFPKILTIGAFVQAACAILLAYRTLQRVATDLQLSFRFLISSWLINFSMTKSKDLILKKNYTNFTSILNR